MELTRVELTLLSKLAKTLSTEYSVLLPAKVSLIYIS